VRALALLGLALWALGAPPVAGAQEPGADSSAASPPSRVDSAAVALPSPADSSLHQFLHDLSDSTDHYFGLTAAPLDTAGLDSALAAGLAMPWRGQRSRVRYSYLPVYAFNRVDGSLWGASAEVNRGSRWRVGGDLGYTGGSNRLLGGGELAVNRRRHDTFWGLRVRGGRRTAAMDRDYQEKRLATLRALISGDDRQHYLRRDGYDVTLSGQGDAWQAALAFRDMLESPLDVTTRWNLTRQPLEVPDNLAAAFGRTRELALAFSTRLPVLPFSAQLTHQTSDQALGSDFDYHRTRVALGGEMAMGGRVSFLPQLVYGRLGGDAVPQASFYLGGPRTLRSLPVAALGGTGFALARLDVIGADDLLALAHIPHPAMFPLQGGLFVATGAVWGADPFGGPGSPAAGWPEKPAWLSEVGASLLYRPGIPDDDGYFRLNYAHPLGPGDREGRWSVSYSRALDLLRGF
jgi:hypothetical protein